MSINLSFISGRQVSYISRFALTLLMIGTLSAIHFSPLKAQAFITVNLLIDRVANDGKCTLREAIINANTDTASSNGAGECESGGGVDTISFEGITGTIALTSSLPAITTDLSLVGNGLTITRDASASDFSIFTIDSSTVTLKGMIIKGGKAVAGGGIYNRSGNITIEKVVIDQNTATGSGGGVFNDSGSITFNASVVSGNLAGSSGAGIFSLSSTTSPATILLTDTTVSNNQATSSGGGFYLDGGILTLVRSTFWGNSAISSGGGIYGDGAAIQLLNSTFSSNVASSAGGAIFNTGKVKANNSTIAFNSAVYGGGVNNSGQTFDLANTIVAKNTGSDCSGVLNSLGYNLIQITQGCTISGNAGGVITGQDPLLGLLGNYGGLTQTYNLLQGSPAIDAGNPALIPDPFACEATDQLGIVRTFGIKCDIGAFESSFEPTPPPIVPVAPPIDGTVIRGKVMTRDGTPLPNVNISVAEVENVTPEVSHSDGTFSLLVHRAGLFTVTYQKDGYLPVQRQANAKWQDYAWADDVMMVPLDTKVTPINLSNSTIMQVAQGNPVTDADGTRQATLLIPAGTTASMIMPDGSTKPMTSLSIRATEYTVGTNGPESMPGSLPANTAYTYAVEYSADEAIAADATSVTFNQQIYSYVENFLNFPVGMIVPSGYYDRVKNLWIASPNGQVVKVISITGGLAQLDTNGDGVVDNDASLGVTDAERTKLASLYATGQTFWRVPLTHFTPNDFNWSFAPPLDAEAIKAALWALWNFISHLLDDPCRRKGSVIECQNQTLGESIPVVGTDLSLNYRSDRVPGHAGDYTLSIPLSGDTVPASLKGIELEIYVAGQRFLQKFSNQPNQQTTFTWDGKDAYGRTIVGKRPVEIRVGYVYKGVYAVPSSPQFSLIRSGSFGGQGASLTAVLARQDYIVWRETLQELGTLDNRSLGLGGWSLDTHHTYSPYGKILYLGDGSRRSTESLNYDVISLFAGGKQICLNPNCGDGGPALQAAFGTARYYAVGPDNSVYISDSGLSRIRRITPDGIITVVAGTRVAGFSGDGGSAIQAQLNNPRGIAIGPDNSIYFADAGNDRIRRISPDGIITTVIGSGVVCVDYATGCGDGGRAIDAQLSRPTYIAMAPDGSIYITEGFANYVRRVSPDGIISRFVGIVGRNSSTGDGGPANQATMFLVSGVAVGPDGSVYIADRFLRFIRRVDSAGIITTFAGTGGACSETISCGDGGLATQASFVEITGLSIGPDGSLYVADTSRVRRIKNGIITTLAGSGVRSYSGDGGPAKQAAINDILDVAVGPDSSVYISGDTTGINPAIRRIGSTFPGLTAGTTLIASEDGSQVYAFDANGRHLRTVNAYTGAVIYQFGYDSAGLLTTITDGNNNITTIEHDAAGNPTAIVSPYGQRTTLAVDGNRFLSSVSNPLNESFQFESSPDGLLTKFTNPRGKSTLFAYDTKGLLIRHEDAVNATMTLSRVVNNQTYTVNLITGAGRTTTYNVNTDNTNNQTRTNTLPSNLQTTYTQSTNGTQSSQSPDGNSSSWTVGADPRWGMLAPIDTSSTSSTPSGLVATTSTTRTATLIDPNNIFSLNTLVETLVMNGHTYKSSYVGASRTFTDTTPTGRQVTTTIDSQGRPLSEQTVGLAAITYTYDTRGRISTATQAGRVMTFTYNSAGYVETITDPLGRITSFVYDGAGRVTQETLPGGRVIQYAYDANGNMTSLTPPGQPVHTFAYTAVDEMASYTPPDVNPGSDQTAYSYNLDKQLTGQALPDGRTIAFGYDTAGRLNALTIARGVFNYTYNSTTGNLATITAPGGINLAYTYDGFLPISETWSGPVTGSVSRVYNNNFRQTSISVNGANPIALTYDNDILLTGVGAMTLTRNTQNGLLTGTTLSNVTDSYGYNTLGERSSYSAAYSGAGLYTVNYTRDILGRIATLNETIGGVTHVYGYSYDAAGWLATVTRDGATVESYTYDLNGNRLSFTGSSSTVNGMYDAQDRLLSYGSSTYTYNANGDLTGKVNGAQTTSYSYDELGNLTRVTLPGGRVIDYLIDGQNRRVGKVMNGSRTQGFLWEDDLRASAELDGANNIVSRFVYAEGVNVPAYMIRSGVTYRILTDHLGSVRLVINTANGSIAQRMDYDSFGRVIQDTNPGFQPFGFAGGLYDADTGLVRFGVRDYDAEVGRWTTKDPIGFSGGTTNLYGYASGDPLNHTDSTGLLTGKFAVKALEKLGEIGEEGGEKVIETGIGKALSDTASTRQGRINIGIAVSASLGMANGAIIGAGLGAAAGGIGAIPGAAAGAIVGTALGLGEGIIDGLFSEDTTWGRAIDSAIDSLFDHAFPGIPYIQGKKVPCDTPNSWDLA